MQQRTQACGGKVAAAAWPQIGAKDIRYGCVLSAGSKPAADELCVYGSISGRWQGAAVQRRGGHRIAL